METHSSFLCPGVQKSRVLQSPRRGDRSPSRPQGICQGRRKWEISTVDQDGHSLRWKEPAISRHWQALEFKACLYHSSLCRSCIRAAHIFSCVQLFATLRIVACQAPLSMGFFRQEYKNTGVDYHSLLQGIFPTHGLNLSPLHLLHCKWILYHWATREAPL